jgi:hypothetical protein
MNHRKGCWITAVLISSCAFALPCVKGAEKAPEAAAPATRTELFNGKDLKGWTSCMKSKADDPAQTWQVTNGVIHCTGAAIGYLRSLGSYRDYKLTVEWRFVKIAPKADNTGVLVHMQLPDKVWPKCVQCQGKHGRQGDLFLMSGAESREHQGKDSNTAVPMHGPSAEKPVGEWDTVELVCKGDGIQATVNGKLMNEITACTVSSGFIGVQSEGADFEIRKMTIEPLK